MWGEPEGKVHNSVVEFLITRIKIVEKVCIRRYALYCVRIEKLIVRQVSVREVIGPDSTSILGSHSVTFP